MRKNKNTGIIAIYASLTKYKLSLAVTFSSITGYFICRNNFDNSLLLLIPGVFFLASGAAALNQYTEREYDARMERTRYRPIPAGRINPRIVLFLSAALILGGVALLTISGPLPAILGLSDAILYNFIYTYLKRITPLAIVPGSLVGAIPPFIGYIAAGGTYPGKTIVLFSIYMFLWQLPHFWLIIIKYHEEYKKAGFKTIYQNITERKIRILIFIWGLLSTIVLLFLSVMEPVFSRKCNIALIPLNMIFILLFYKLLFNHTGQQEINRAYNFFNAFSLLIMLFFIVNSFLS
jgi:heme o synthase